MTKEIEIPSGYEARIDGNKVIIEPKESEDERIRKELMNFVAEVKNIAKSGRDSWVVRKEDVEMCERFLAYLEKQKEQKSADVSEKIEELCSKYPLNKGVMSEEALSAYHQGLAFGATRIAEYLGVQQPAEWSEEDKKMLNNTLDSLKRYQLSMPNFQVELQMRWLKSLRLQPHWKPSEEQMEALNNCVSKARGIHNASMGGYDIYPKLQSLYNDLKKL